MLPQRLLEYGARHVSLGLTGARERPILEALDKNPLGGDAGNKPTLTPREYPLVAEQADAAHSKCAARTGM